LLSSLAMHPLIALLLLLTLLGVLMGITVLLHRNAGWSTEQSRKFLHVSGGILSLTLPLFFQSHWWVLALAVVAFGILLFTFLRRLMPAVHATKRNSVGSVLFPIPVYVCFLVAELQHSLLYFWLPVALLAFADTAAEIGGNRWGKYSRPFFGGQKTMAGTLCFGCTALLVCIICLRDLYAVDFTRATIVTIVITVATTLAEWRTLRGWDNLSVPATALLLLWMAAQISPIQTFRG